MMIRHSRKQQRGYIAGLTLVLVVLAILAVAYARHQLVVANREAGASLGYALEQVSSALTRYRKDKFLELTSNATPTIAGVANPMAPTVDELKALGYLNTAVSSTLLGNAYQTGVFRNPAGCVGPAATCDLFSVLWLKNPILDSTTGNPNIDKLGSTIASVSESAGYSALPDLTKITGNQGGWTIVNPDPQQRAGIVAVVSGLGGFYPAFLQVGDPRDPALTGNATVAGYIRPSAGVGQTVIAGDSCTTVPAGSMKADTAGRILSCQGGKWKATDGSNTAITIAPVNNVVGGTTFPVIACAPGGTPWATYSAQLSAVNDALIPPVEVVQYSVSRSGNSWVTLTEAVRPPSGPVTVNSDPSILGATPRGVFAAGCSYPS